MKWICDNADKCRPGVCAHAYPHEYIEDNNRYLNNCNVICHHRNGKCVVYDYEEIEFIADEEFEI